MVLISLTLQLDLFDIIIFIVINCKKQRCFKITLNNQRKEDA